MYDLWSKNAFKAYFNETPFLLQHSFHTHELFAISQIRKLAQRLARQKIPRGYFYLAGKSRRMEWGSKEFQRTLDDAFDHWDTSQMRLKISYIHKEPEYKEWFEACCQSLDQLTAGQLTRDFKKPLATLFVTSPSQITPCHVDEEVNFLHQLHGTKSIYIYDARDPEIVTWEILEKYWGAGAFSVRDDLRARCKPYTLEPGLAVHNPVFCPHWVQNGPSQSVSLSVAFNLLQQPSDVLRLNYYLRRLGMKPSPPGQRPALDSVKRTAARSARFARNTLNSARTALNIH